MHIGRHKVPSMVLFDWQKFELVVQLRQQIIRGGQAILMPTIEGIGAV